MIARRLARLWDHLTARRGSSRPSADSVVPGELAVVGPNFDPERETLEIANRALDEYQSRKRSAAGGAGHYPEPGRG